MSVKLKNIYLLVLCSTILDLIVFSLVWQERYLYPLSPLTFSILLTLMCFQYKRYKGATSNYFLKIITVAGIILTLIFGIISAINIKKNIKISTEMNSIINSLPQSTSIVRSKSDNPSILKLTSNSEVNTVTQFYRNNIDSNTWSLVSSKTGLYDILYLHNIKTGDYIYIQILDYEPTEIEIVKTEYINPLIKSGVPPLVDSECRTMDLLEF